MTVAVVSDWPLPRSTRPPAIGTEQAKHRCVEEPMSALMEAVTGIT